MKLGLKGNIVLNKNNIFKGVNAGSDWYAEHEHGIQDIFQKFQTAAYTPKVTKSFLEKIRFKSKKTKCGVEYRRVNDLSCLRTGKISYQNSTYYYIATDRNSNQCKEYCKSYTNIINKNGFAAFWDWKSFLFLFTENLKEEYDVLNTAFNEKDIYITIYTPDDYNLNPGLYLGIISREDPEVIQEMENKDID